MNFWSITLIATGALCIAVSLAKSRHAPGSEDFLAVHKSMDDDQINSQLKHGRWRVDATLGIQFGCIFIVFGLLWQLLVSIYWF